MRACVIVIGLPLLLTLSACGADPSPTPAATAPGDALAGDWVLVDGTVDGAPLPIVDGFRITLAFRPDLVAGTSGCNSYSADTRVDGTVIVIGQATQTLMGCADDVLTAELAYLAALRSVERVEVVDERLELTGPTVSLSFERMAGLDEGAIDVDWILVSWATPDIVERQAMGMPSRLRIDSNGTITGSTGCRTLSGTWLASADEIGTPQFGANQVSCPEWLMEQDAQVTSVLGDGFIPAVHGDVMTVTSTGNLTLTYHATPAGRDEDPQAHLGDWVLDEGFAAREILPLPDHPPMTLTFEPDLFRAGAVCNTIGGRYELRDGAMRTSQMSGSEIGCLPPELHELEGDYIGIIAAAAAVEVVDGRLHIVGQAGELWFTADEGS